LPSAVRTASDIVAQSPSAVTRAAEVYGEGAQPGAAVPQAAEGDLRVPALLTADSEPRSRRSPLSESAPSTEVKTPRGIEGVRAQAKQMAREVIASVEFLGKAPASSDYVARLYRAFLGRLPSSPEVAYWSGQLDSGAQSTDDLIDLFADSLEFSMRLQTFFSP